MSAWSYTPWKPILIWSGFVTLTCLVILGARKAAVEPEGTIIIGPNRPYLPWQNEENEN